MLNRSQRSLTILLVTTFILRLCWAASLETGQDEAYHFLYAVHPDWSYFDHPPMLMYVTKLGITVFGGWLHPLSLRFGFIVMFAGSTVILYLWTARWYGDKAGFYAALALNLSAYYTAAAGVFVLPDGPLLFFALLTMWRLGEALVASPGSLRPWIGVGIGCAGAMLSKYHAVFLPIGAVVYVIVTPSARRLLLTPGPYLASAIGFLGLLPVLYWNSQHDWASFGFQTGRAVGGKIQWTGLAVMLFGPMALLLPWIWYPLIEILVGKVRLLRSLAGIDRLLVCLAVVPLGLFTLVSATRAILPHWPLMGFLPLFPLLGAYWATLTETRPRFVNRWLVFMSSFLLVAASCFVAQARWGVIQFPFRDPCIEISGWDSVGQEFERRGLIDRPNTFVFTNHWFESGQIAFATRNRIPVCCYRQGDPRGLAFWSQPDDWLGKDAVLLDSDLQDNLADVYRPYFREITALPDIEMTRGGRPFRPVRLYLCSEQLQPFPFKYERKQQSTAK